MNKKRFNNRIGIVILNYNESEMTINLATKICQYKSIDYVVIVDNHSTDDSYKLIKKIESTKIKVLHSQTNDGYSSGNNIGIRWLLENTDVDIIGISNPDVLFEEELTDRVSIMFDKMENYGIITGLQLDRDGGVADHPFWQEYTVGQWFKVKLSGLRLIYYITKWNPSRNYIRKKVDDERSFIEVGAVEGSLFFSRASLLKQVGLFDENVKFYCEEDILAKKYKLIEKKIGVDKSVNYIHLGSVTTKKNFGSFSKTKYMRESSIYFFNNYLTKNPILIFFNYTICGLKYIEDCLAISVKNRFCRTG